MLNIFSCPHMPTVCFLWVCLSVKLWDLYIWDRSVCQIYDLPVISLRLHLVLSSYRVFCKSKVFDFDEAKFLFFSLLWIMLLVPNFRLFPCSRPEDFKFTVLRLTFSQYYILIFLKWNFSRGLLFCLQITNHCNDICWKDCLYSIELCLHLYHERVGHISCEATSKFSFLLHRYSV